MSIDLEAVPCMFKQRQEDGTEIAQLGLLIRPSTSTAVTALPAGSSKQPLSSSSSDQLTATVLQPITPTVPPTVLSSAVDVNNKKESSMMLKEARSAAMPLAFPPGMPPILPRRRPKTGQQQPKLIMPKTSIKMLTTPIVSTIVPSMLACNAAGTSGSNKIFEVAQSPSQVVPQLCQQSADGMLAQADVLSIATTSGICSAPSSVSPGSSSSASGGSLLAIQSPLSNVVDEKCQKQKKAKQQQKSEKSSSNSKRRRPKQQENAAAFVEEAKASSDQPTVSSNGEQHQDGLLGEDLHSIDYSQLVNSTVITTEDYLPSQSEPIYTSLDMYNPPAGPAQNTATAVSQQHQNGQHQTQQSHHQQTQSPSQLQQAHFVDPTMSAQQPHQLCPSAIYLHNQRHQQYQHPMQHFQGPCSSSSTVTIPGHPQNRFIGHIPLQQQHFSAVHQQHQQHHGPQQYQQTTASLPGSNSGQHAQQGWNPYLATHPGQSHISSTPDSGIQSIDGSPPSVYTPPMVSPYASQVRSCESVGTSANNGHSNGTLMANGNQAAVSSCYASTSAGSLNGTMCTSDANSLLLMSPPMANQQHPPRLYGNHHQREQSVHCLTEECEEVEECQEGANDFSDMPKLVPVTHMEHDEVIDGEDTALQQPSTSMTICEQQRDERRPTSSSTTTPSPTKAATLTNDEEVVFHPGMCLQEFAERISTKIPPEQLQQLTSFIQSKAAAESTTKAQKADKIEGKKPRKKGKEKSSIVSEPSSSNACGQPEKKLKRQKRTEKPTRTESMVTSRQPELKAKCEKLVAKVNAKETFSSQLKPSSSSSTSGIVENDNNSRKDLLSHDNESDGMAHLVAYRRHVRAHLNRKLETFTERVCLQLEATHLDIEKSCWLPTGWTPFPLKQLDWEEVKKRVAAAIRREKSTGNGQENQMKVPKKRGRKKKEEKAKQQQTFENQRREKEDKEHHRIGRKRRRMEDSADVAEGKRARLDRSKEAKKEGSTQKQKTPPIIVKLPNVLRENDNQKMATNPIVGTAAHKNIRPTSKCIATKCPSPPTFSSSAQLAIIRANHQFLPRNLRPKKHCVKRVANEDSSELTAILDGIFANFMAQYQQRPMLARRHLRHLNRSVHLLLSTKTTSPLIQLNRFDTLLKQFIANCQNDELRSTYLQLKRSANFTKMRPQLQKEHLQMFMEDRRRSLHQNHQQPSTSSTSLTASIAARRDPSLQKPLTVDTSLDLTYMDSPNPVGRWDPDGAARLSPNSDNREHDCVRCICGMSEDDGVMSQCDRCHFWLHADCLDDPIIDDQKEFECEFCTRQLETTPRVDIVLKPQPSIKLSGCTYYRTLVNSRGLQVRLNEAIYVERLINDKHKSILRELQQLGSSQSPVKVKQRRDNSAGSSVGAKGGRRRTAEKTDKSTEAVEEKVETEARIANNWWPSEQQQSSSSSGEQHEFHRRDLRVFRAERLFISPNGQRFIFGCYYARPHETFCDSSRMFYRNELFWTPLFDTLPLDSVVGRCLILEPQVWEMGRPKTPRYLEDDVYVCEYQIDRNQRSFEKIQPKNRYYINTEPYVFNHFSEQLRMKRDFTPFHTAIEGSSGDQQQNPPNQKPASLATDVRQQLYQDHLEKICARIKTIANQPTKDSD